MFCHKCDSILSLTDTIQEIKTSLASVFMIKCRSCKYVSEVKTDKRHISSLTNRQHYDCNSKIVIGAYNAGIGHAHINKILAALNIPPMNRNIAMRASRISATSGDFCKKRFKSSPLNYSGFNFFNLYQILR